MRPAALDAMVRAASLCGNPTGAHHLARDSRRALDDAREAVADALQAHPAEVVFTGSGTESDNLAIFGACSRPVEASVPVCSVVEHHAVLHPVEHLDGRVVNVHPSGQLDLDSLDEALDEDVAVVSVMLANNETGVIQPLEEIAARTRAAAPQALVHTDAVQAFQWIDVAAHIADVDLVSITGHKFGGPKGVGALLVRRGSGLAPHILGGGQEFELRSGTQNVAGIAAFASAVVETVKERDEIVNRVGALRDRLTDGLLDAIPGTHETALRSDRVAGSCHLCFDAIESEALLFLLERSGIAASAASSCASGAQDPSHVLAAMGWSRELAGGSLRLSLGWGSTDADVDHALRVIPDAVAQLRERAA